MITKFTKGKDAKLSKYFASSEFECSCYLCSEVWIDTDLIILLDKIREYVGQPVHITSGYRCSAKQECLRKAGLLTASGTSQHELGKAADIVSFDWTGAELTIVAQECGVKAIGTGKNFIHIDTRNDKQRRWTY